jgi:hypothetical protein
MPCILRLSPHVAGRGPVWRVGGNAAGQQHPRPAAQDVIDRGDIGPGEQPGQRRLPASVAASVRSPQASQLASLPGDAKFPGHARPVGLMQGFSADECSRSAAR